MLARFIPIIRTFAPFVAGIGKMSYRKFFRVQRRGRNGLDPAVSCSRAGCSAGFRWSRRTSSYVIVAIIVISVLPGVCEFFRAVAQASDRRPSVSVAQR